MPNETITGKIYPVWNADKTERRFPQTVIEAVLGLPTYLQDQFSALADIYMPIEGITESKTGQEFVYRKSPATIKAKSLTLDRIYGKTLAYNQMINGVKVVSGSASVSNNEFTISGTCTIDEPSITTIIGHKYLVKVMYSGSFVGSVRIVDYLTGSRTAYHEMPTSDNVVAYINTASRAITDTVNISCYSYTSGTLKGRLVMYDLTLMFGSGNEPSTVAEFDAIYAGYIAPSLGKLISNDAAAVETVGFNLWDEEWMNAHMNSDGSVTTDSTAVMSKNHVPVFAETTYYLKCSNKCYVVFYDANKNMIGSTNGVSNSSFVTPSGCSYLRFNTWSGSGQYGGNYNHDICINLSDPAKNGTYEPYRKSTMPLNLNAIKVYSHNIWDEQWELGLYNNSTGEKASWQTTIRNVNPLSVLPNTIYYFKAPYGGLAYFYDQNGVFLSYTDITRNSTFTTPANCYRLNFRVATEYGTTYNNDICINVSSSFNGQYEPHGILTIEGLKGAGSVYDEIVSNKLVKRVGSVDLGTLSWAAEAEGNLHANFNHLFSDIVNWTTVAIAGPILSGGGYTVVPRSAFDGSAAAITKSVATNSKYIMFTQDSYTSAASFKAAMSGVMLYYELATPIEYELAEPLVYSMAAGTTEERISPNSDGLSAPFCCDMTYSASENNDSANAQYALTAGRLLNTHKLWGQDFNGTEDVSGALSGVTNIAMSGAISGLTNINSVINISSSNVGIGKTPSVKLDVSGAIAGTFATFSGTRAEMLVLNNGETNASTCSATLQVGGSNKVSIGFTGSRVGAYMQNLSVNGTPYVNIASDGAFKYNNSYTFYHSNNSNKNTVDWTAKNLSAAGTLNASGNTTLGSTLGVAGNTTIGGTFTVGTSSVNKATTLYGALTASGAVSFTSTLGVTGLSTLAGGIKLTTTKKIWFGDTYFIGLDANNHLYTNAGFYSTSFITAGGVGSGSGGGSNLVKEREYGISLTQITSSDYVELIHSPYINDSDSGFMFAYSPAFLDTASQMHDYVIDAIGHEIGSCNIEWIGIAIGSTYTDLGVFDSGAFLVLAKNGNTYYWYEFEV